MAAIALPAKSPVSRPCQLEVGEPSEFEYATMTRQASGDCLPIAPMLVLPTNEAQQRRAEYRKEDRFAATPDHGLQPRSPRPGAATQRVIPLSEKRFASVIYPADLIARTMTRGKRRCSYPNHHDACNASLSNVRRPAGGRKSGRCGVDLHRHVSPEHRDQITAACARPAVMPEA